MAKKKLKRASRGTAQRICFEYFEKHPRMSNKQIAEKTKLGYSTVCQKRQEWNDLPLVAPSSSNDTLPYLLGGIVIGITILFVLIQTGVL